MQDYYFITSILLYLQRLNYRMKNKFKTGFWEVVAHIVLRNRITILVIIGLLTLFLSLQFKNVGMTYNEANLLPKNHIVNQQYTQF